jgi:glycerate-2-kinase
MGDKNYLKDLFHRTLTACSPGNAVKEAVQLDHGEIRIGSNRFKKDQHPIYVIAVGKASVPMFESLYSILGSRITKSLVITPNAPENGSANKIITANHPVPDEESIKAGRTAVSFMENVPTNALIITLISGGTSSLMCNPAAEISLSDLRATFDLLNQCGASISEINTVRKHCSRIKGGQLLRLLPEEAILIDLIISDVPNDDPAFIGSGPTVADPSTYQDAYHVLLEYKLWDTIPAAVRDHIEKGLTGEVMETLKPKEELLKRHETGIISSAEQFVSQAAQFASRDGYETELADQPFNEDVETVASNILDKVLSNEDNKSKPVIFFFYGESRVEVTGEGKGGRNQELALRGALKIAGYNNIIWLSAGTDGIDGPTDAAGAIVDGRTLSKARDRGMDPGDFLGNNDSYHFHKQLDTLLVTGPTGNNLMDVVFVIRN